MYCGVARKTTRRADADEVMGSLTYDNVKHSPYHVEEAYVHESVRIKTYQLQLYVQYPARGVSFS